MGEISCPGKVQRTVYRFGAQDGGNFGHVVLHGDGTLGGYSHENEASFSFDGQALNFHHADGHVSSRLRYREEANCFFAYMPSSLYLLPALELGPWQESASGLPPVFVNSIPKSGTYFLEAALTAIGGTALRLHLSAHDLHDYRNLPDEEMHRAPALLYRPVPAGAVAHVMRPGEVVVGHVDDHAQLDEFARANVVVLNCVRNLRDVLVSLYHFKLRKVAPVSAADQLWRSLAPVPGFAAFLAHFAEQDIAHIRHMAEVILGRQEPILRFEDALQGRLSVDLSPAGLPQEPLQAALNEVRNQQTSTYSGETSSHAELWSDAVEAFFHDSGLYALNARMGYEAGLATAEAA